MSIPVEPKEEVNTVRTWSFHDILKAVHMLLKEPHFRTLEGPHLTVPMDWSPTDHHDHSVTCKDPLSKLEIHHC